MKRKMVRIYDDAGERKRVLNLENFARLIETARISDVVVDAEEVAKFDDFGAYLKQLKKNASRSGNVFCVRVDDKFCVWFKESVDSYLIFSEDSLNKLINNDDMRYIYDISHEALVLDVAADEQE